MGVRNEAVRLSLEDAGFSTGMARHTAEAIALAVALDKVDGSSVKTDKSTRQAAAAVDVLGSSTRSARSDLDKFSGRLGIIRDVALTLGPSLVPIGAVGIPAVTGLANQFGFAAIAAGTAVIAFQGVGDALSAVNKASIDPTAANIEKAHLAMQQISPVARDLVKTLSGMKPVFQELRDTGAEGLFPGVIEGLESLEQLAPKVERIIREVSFTLSDLIAEGADSLAGDRWSDFFGMIATDARPVLTDMAHSIGDVAHGLAEMWMAFQPLNRDFGSWLADSADAFDRWATGLSETQGFQDFIAYIRENGPRVADAMGSIGNALVQVVQAVAPLGGPSLAIIEGFADAIALLAGSPVGPSLFAIAAGMAAISRATRIMGPGLGSMSDAFLDLRTSPDKARTAIERFGGAAKAVAGGAGIALFATSLTESNDQLRKLESTAGGALAGFAVGGPWGAGIGAVAGLLVGLAGGADEASEEVKALVDTLDQATGAITDLTRSAVVKSLEDEGVLAQAEALGVSLDTVTEAALGNADALGVLKAARDAAIESGRTQYEGDARSFNQNSEQIGQYDQLIDKLEDQSGAIGQASAAHARMREAMGDSAAAADDYTNAMDRSAAATDSLRGPLFRANRTLLQNQRVIGALKDRIADANEAIAQQAAEWGDYSQKVDLAGTGIDTIISRMKKLADAATNEAANIQQLLKEGFDPAAIQNLIDTLGPQGAALAIDQLANGGKKLRSSFLHAFDGLTDGEEKVENALRGVDEGITGTRHKVKELQNENVDIKATLDTGALMNQANRADSTLNNLGRKKPTPKATLDPTDLFNKANSARVVLNNLDGMHPSPKVKLDGAAAVISEANRARAAILGIPLQRTVQITFARNNIDIDRADGGLITGPGGPRDDAVPVNASNGEFMIQAAAVQKYGVGFFARANAMNLAEGGLITRSRSLPRSSSAYMQDPWLDLEKMAAAVDGATSGVGSFADETDKSTKSLDKELKARERMLTMEQQAVQEKIQALRDEKRAIIESVAARLADPFGDSGGPTAADFMGDTTGMTSLEIYQQQQIAQELADSLQQSPTDILQNNVDQLNQLSQLINQLEGLGLHGDALAAVIAGGDIGQIQALIASGSSGVRQYQHLYNQQQNLANQVGNQAAGAVGVNAELRESRKELQHIKQELKQIHHAQERREEHAAHQRDKQTKATEHVGEDTARELNNTTSRAMTGARRRG